MAAMFVLAMMLIGLAVVLASERRPPPLHRPIGWIIKPIGT
ncbi:MAG TPA: hypothetical protein VFB13_17935 [Reyranella sp.]|nr:hypothetical protein [Reyranella sp.]